MAQKHQNSNFKKTIKHHTFRNSKATPKKENKAWEKIHEWSKIGLDR